MVIVSFKPKIPQNNNAFCLASKSNKQNPPNENLDSPFFFCFEHTTSLENHLSVAQSESLPYWFGGNISGRVSFYLAVESISFVCSH